MMAIKNRACWAIASWAHTTQWLLFASVIISTPVFGNLCMEVVCGGISKFRVFCKVETRNVVVVKFVSSNDKYKFIVTRMITLSVHCTVGMGLPGCFSWGICITKGVYCMLAWIWWTRENEHIVMSVSNRIVNYYLLLQIEQAYIASNPSIRCVAFCSAFSCDVVVCEFRGYPLCVISNNFAAVL